MTKSQRKTETISS